jgi:hypothetical protein
MNQPPRTELVIRVMADGQVHVSGPLHDKGTCYALLELARDIVKDHVDKMTRSQIVQARPADPFLIPKRS